jgi:hypothetical protein
VHWAFVQLIAPHKDAKKIGPLVELYFPADEPLYRSPATPQPDKTNAA